MFEGGRQLNQKCSKLYGCARALPRVVVDRSHIVSLERFPCIQSLLASDGDVLQVCARRRPRPFHPEGIRSRVHSAATIIVAFLLGTI